MTLRSMYKLHDRTSTDSDQTHPLHLAHLNFYTALSHDTLARGATFKNRWKELSLAEVHYNAAIAALSPLQSPAQCDPWSPISSTTSPPSPFPRRRSSVSSDKSAASSATSLGDDSYQVCAKPTPDSSLRHARNDSAVQAHCGSQSFQRKPLATAPRPQTPQQFYFTGNISSFLRMLESHLADIRDLKRRSSVPTVRFDVPSPRPSPTKAKAPGSRERGSSRPTVLGNEDEDAAMQARRERRKNVVFRPRFDPQSTEKLCNEALAELIE